MQLTWPPDPFSLLIGLALGLLLVLVATTLRRIGVRVFHAIAGLVSSMASFFQRRRQGSYQLEVVEFVASQHLDHRSAPLHQIFVEPRIILPHYEVQNEPGVDSELVEFGYLWPNLARKMALPPPPTTSVRQFLLKSEKAIISAEDGAGKTALLAYCAYKCATVTGDSDLNFLEGMLPIYLHLAEVALLDFGEGTVEFPGAILDSLNARVSSSSLKRVAQHLDDDSTGRNLFILIDGWDELPAERRAGARDWLKNLVETYTDARIVLACAPKGYGHLLELGFTVYGLLPWRIGQGIRLGRRWEGVTRQKAPPVHTYWRPGELPVDVRLKLSLTGSDQIEQSELGSGSRSNLLQITLDRITSAFASPETPWLVSATQDLWQSLAYRLMSHRLLSLTPRMVDQAVESVLERHEVSGRNARRRLVETLHVGGIFVKRGEENIAFQCPIWRDFLAGNHMVSHDLSDVAYDVLKDAYWAGALQYYVVRTGGRALAERLLERPLGQIGEQLYQLASWLPASHDDGEWRRQTLVGLGRTAVEPTAPAPARHRAVVALAASGEQGILIFIRQLLSQSEPHLRRLAIASIVGVAPTVGVKLMEKFRNDADEVVRRAAVHALAWTNDPASEEPLLAALLENDEAQYLAAATGLALNGDAESVEVLREAANDPALNVRIASVHGLAQIEEDWSIALLEKLVEDDSQWAVRAAAEAALQDHLAEGSDPRQLAYRAGDQDWLIRWAVNQGRAVPAGPAAIPVIVEALNDPDEVIRRSAANTLGHLAAIGARDSLMEKLSDSNSNVRSAAYLALCQIARAWDLPFPYEATNRG